MSPDIHLRELECDNTQVAIEATFARFSPNELFDHFVETELLARWWPPQSVSQQRVGGSFHFSWPDMGWDLRGTYAEYIRGRRLVFSWMWDHEPGRPTRLVEIDIEPFEDGSRLTLAHGRYGDSEEDQADRIGHLEGWRFFLGRLCELATGA